MDRTAVVGGLAVAALGALLLLDRTGEIALGFGWAAPAVLAVVGLILVLAGLEHPARR